MSKLDLDNSTASLSPSIQGITSGFYHQDFPLKFSPSSSIVLHNNELGNPKYASIGYTTIPGLSQPRATDTIDVVNYTNKVGRLSVEPALVFINERYKNITPCDPISKAINGLAIQQSKSPIVQTIVSSVNNLLGAMAEQVGESLESGDALSPTPEDEFGHVDYIHNSVRSAPIIITLLASNLTPGSSGYKLYFDSVELGIDKYKYTSGEVVRPDGTLGLEFAIPVGTKCGVHSIEVISDAGYCRNKISIFNNLLNQICLSAAKSWGGLPISTSTSSLLPIYDDLDRDYRVVYSAVSQTFEVDSPGLTNTLCPPGHNIKFSLNEPDIGLYVWGSAIIVKKISIT